MALNTDHVTGFAVGLGAAALGFYLYKKNQGQVDQWLKQQGIHIPEQNGQDTTGMTLEELMTEKEHLEDAIAEREHAAAAEPAAPAEEPS